MMWLSLIASISAPFIIKQSLDHFLSLQVVTIWHFDHLDKPIKKLKEENLNLKIKLVEAKKSKRKRKNKKRPSKKNGEVDMKRHCRDSTYRKTKTCRDWRREKR